jgi:hypothetical protein
VRWPTSGFGRSFQHKNKWVQQLGRQPPNHDPEQLDGETIHVAPQDIRRRTYRDPYARRAALRQIDGNLSAAPTINTSWSRYGCGLR